MDDDRGRVLDVGELRRAAATLAHLPAWPWDAVELTAVQRHGPSRWDPDVQPSLDAHGRHELLRATRACWRGLVDADGGALVGHDVAPGSAPRPVVDPTWRWAASSPQLVADLLATVRSLWPPRAQRDVDAPAGAGTSADDRAGHREVTPQVLRRAAAAAHDAVPTPTSFEQLPLRVQLEWVRRVEAALAALDG